jgi:hypothetical protein
MCQVERLDPVRPDFITDAYVRYVTAPAGTKQRHRGFRQMELAFKSYLPRIEGEDVDALVRGLGLIKPRCAADPE